MNFINSINGRTFLPQRLAAIFSKPAKPLKTLENKGI